MQTVEFAFNSLSQLILAFLSIYLMLYYLYKLSNHKPRYMAVIPQRKLATRYQSCDIPKVSAHVTIDIK